MSSLPGPDVQGARIPDALIPLLDGQGLASKEGETFLLITAAETGWPHVALLSVGEVLACSPQELRLALWGTSRTTANLTRSGQAVLFLVHGRGAYILQLAARRLQDIEVDGRTLACFSARVVNVEEHVSDYADMTSGLRFRLHQREPVLDRWARTLQALRGVGERP